jgi:hypothetical protein
MTVRELIHELLNHPMYADVFVEKPQTMAEMWYPDRHSLTDVDLQHHFEGGTCYIVLQCNPDEPDEIVYPEEGEL